MTAALNIDGRDVAVPGVEARVLIVAKAIWSGRDDPGIRALPPMSWDRLLECLESNPGQWSADYERVIRQARAIVAMDIPTPDVEAARDAVIQAVRDWKAVRGEDMMTRQFARRALIAAVTALDALEQPTEERT